MSGNKLALFGGNEPWSPVDWTDSDDRVRGGKSQSYISATPFESVARFYGNLDIDTLGGAGFASQRTTGERSLDLSSYDGIELELEKGDELFYLHLLNVFGGKEKRYTFILKDSILPPDPESGREQSSISYEYDFGIDQYRAMSDTLRLKIPWSAFTATYRGKERPDAPVLNKKSVKRISIMMRSFFGAQKGPFTLSIRSISAYAEEEPEEGFSLGRFWTARSVTTFAIIGATMIVTGIFLRISSRLAL